jgi:hypothetical protein
MARESGKEHVKGEIIPTKRTRTGFVKSNSMKDHNDIDQLFKDGLQEHGIPFNESYADRLNVQLKKRTRGERVMLYGMAVMLLAIVSIAIVNFKDKTGEDIKKVVTTEVGPESNKPSSIIGQTKSAAQKDLVELEKSLSNSLQEGSSFTHMEKTQSFEQGYQNNLSKSSISLTKTTKTHRSSLTVEDENDSGSFYWKNDYLLMAAISPISRILELEYDYGQWAIHTGTRSKGTAVSIEDFSILKNEKTQRPITKRNWLYTSVMFGSFSADMKPQPLKTSFSKQQVFGVEAGFSLQQSWWELRLGVGATQMRESVSLDYDETLEELSFDTTVRMTVPFYGQTPRGSRVALLQEFYDTTRTTYTEARSVSANNQYRYLSIPGYVGFQHQKGRVSLSAGIAGTLHILTSAQGRMPIQAEGETPQLIDVNTSGNVATTFTTGGLEASVGYRVLPKIKLSGGLSHQRNLSSGIQSLQQNFSTTQVRVGLSVLLR